MDGDNKIDFQEFLAIVGDSSGGGSTRERRGSGSGASSHGYTRERRGSTSSRHSHHSHQRTQEPAMTKQQKVAEAQRVTKEVRTPSPPPVRGAVVMQAKAHGGLAGDGSLAAQVEPLGLQGQEQIQAVRHSSLSSLTSQAFRLTLLVLAVATAGTRTRTESCRRVSSRRGWRARWV